MKNALKSNQRRGNCVHKTFKIEMKKGDQIIQTFFKSGSPHKLGPPLQLAEIPTL